MRAECSVVVALGLTLSGWDGEAGVGLDKHMYTHALDSVVNVAVNHYNIV